MFDCFFPLWKTHTENDLFASAPEGRQSGRFSCNFATFRTKFPLTNIPYRRVHLLGPFRDPRTHSKRLKFHKICPAVLSQCHFESLTLTPFFHRRRNSAIWRRTRTAQVHTKSILGLSSSSLGRWWLSYPKTGKHVLGTGVCVWKRDGIKTKQAGWKMRAWKGGDHVVWRGWTLGGGWRGAVCVLVFIRTMNQRANGWGRWTLRWGRTGQVRYFSPKRVKCPAANGTGHANVWVKRVENIMVYVLCTLIGIMLRRATGGRFIFCHGLEPRWKGYIIGFLNESALLPGGWL